MLAGLLFATHEAEDRAGQLAATLPFGGVTLIEYQARLLAGHGVAHLIVIVQRLTPELVAAIHRIGRRGVTVDAVRTAAEAKAKLHPLARVVAIADGLVTSDAVVGLLAREGGDSLLVTDAADVGHGFERLGSQLAWAGVARLDPQRLADVAALPRDYDVQSALVRVAEQAQAHHLLLPAEDLRRGHGIEHRAATLEARSHDVMAALVSSRPAWFDRWIVAPVARFALPAIVRRSMSSMAAALVPGALALAGLGGLAAGWPASGIALVLVATICAAIVATLAWLRDEPLLVRMLKIGSGIACAWAALLVGWNYDQSVGGETALTLAIVLVATGVLVARAGDEADWQRWWATPPAWLLVIGVGVAAGFPLAGLALAAGYAAATLASAIEGLRQA